LIDEPANLGGTDKGPNPVEYILAALGGCINVLVISFADQFDVQVKDVDIQVEGDLNPDGFLGKDPNVRPGYEEIRYQIKVDSPSISSRKYRRTTGPCRSLLPCKRHITRNNP